MIIALVRQNTKDKKMKIGIAELRERILEMLGSMPKADADAVADYFIWAEMSGNKTQGIIKMGGSDPIQNIVRTHAPKIEKETPVSALIDGGRNPAIVVADMADEIAIKKARASGIAIVGARNTFSSNGSQAYYSEKIAKQDLIGIMMSRSPGTVAPFGSIDPIFGTNPLGFGFPTMDSPILFDAATSAMTFYGVVVADAKGEELPESAGAMDRDGNPTRRPSDVIGDGSLAPFGGHYKAAGFSMMIELLAGPLIGAGYCDKDGKESWGTVIIAIDPGILTDVSDFKKNCSDFVRKIRESRTHVGESIRMPHDESRRKYNEAERDGFVEIDDVLFTKIFG